MATKDDMKLNKFKCYLESWYPIKYLGILKYFLGVEVSYSLEDLIISKRKYTPDILREACLLGGKPCNFLIGQNHKLALDDSPFLHDCSSYHHLVGHLIYLTIT